MQASRRQFGKDILVAAASVALFGFVYRSRPVLADARSTDAALTELIGNKKPKPGRITLTLPQIAEDGSTVKISFSVDSPMTKNNYVKAVHLFADGNPRPNVGSFYFTPRSGRATTSTRIRLAKTQNVIALAEMSDGSVYMAKNHIKVTIGGCG